MALLVVTFLVVLLCCGRAIERPPLARHFIKHIYKGRDPFATVGNTDNFKPLPNYYTHLNSGTVDLVLELLGGLPLTFWIEVGTLEGRSAVLVASHLKQRHGNGNVTILCIDTYLGELEYLWRFALPSPGEEDFGWKGAVGEDGLPQFLRRFAAHVQRSGHHDVILPVLAPSTSGLRVLRRLHKLGQLHDLPQVIYLDSSHEFDETLIEIELAWSLLAPGGVLFGDDWAFPDRDVAGVDASNPGSLDWQDTTVQRAVLMWAAMRADELDDSALKVVRRTQSIIRVRHGVFITVSSWQWIVKKQEGLHEVAPLNLGLISGSREHFLERAVPKPAWDCFHGEYADKKGACCDTARGPKGDASCFDLHYTFNKCC